MSDKLQLQLFFIKDANVFAVLDGASISDLLDKLKQYQPEYYCLYPGELIPELEKASPYLVKLEKDSAFTQWVCEGYGKNWGIFVAAKANLRTLRNHFRELLTVEDSKGNPMYFRFYDPRIFQVFLPTCTDDEKKLVFGPVLCYFAEVEEDTSGVLTQFSM